MTAVTVDTLDVTPQQKTHLLGQVIHEYRRRRALGHSPVVAAAWEAATTDFPPRDDDGYIIVRTVA